MKEQLAEWLNVRIDITVDTFSEQLKNGEILCRYANYITQVIRSTNTEASRTNEIPKLIKYRKNPLHADVAGVRKCLLFEVNDLMEQKNERNVIVCLVEAARFGGQYGRPVPTTISALPDLSASQKDTTNTLRSSCEK